MLFHDHILFQPNHNAIQYKTLKTTVFDRKMHPTSLNIERQRLVTDKL